ncbi:hypothetical protein C240_2997 [Enterococcus sp. 5H]|nr:hypothetical protein [Enterococcus sp. 5H]
MTSTSKEVKVPGNHSSIIPLKIAKTIFSDRPIVTDLNSEELFICLTHDKKKSL